MKFFTKRKDGGAESTVTGWWLIEAKSLFSVCLLRFDGRSREAFHTHAFNCLSWVISGDLMETFIDGTAAYHPASWRPFVTLRTHFHKVSSITGRTWVLTFRGPWARRWEEYLPATDEFVTLTDGRVVLARSPANLA